MITNHKSLPIPTTDQFSIGSTITQIIAADLVRLFSGIAVCAWSRGAVRNERGAAAGGGHAQTEVAPVVAVGLAGRAGAVGVECWGGFGGGGCGLDWGGGACC